MTSGSRLGRGTVILVIVGLFVVGAGVGGYLVVDRSETLPAYTLVEFDTTYDAANDTLQLKHVSGDTLCRTEVYVIIQRNSTQGATTYAWVTSSSQPHGEIGGCREVSVSDSFVLTDADLEPGDRIKVVWQTNRGSVPEEQRRKVLAEHVVGAENATDREPTAPA